MGTIAACSNLPVDNIYMTFHRADNNSATINFHPAFFREIALGWTALEWLDVICGPFLNVKNLSFFHRNATGDHAS
jgi:hypothetical protein